MAGGCVNVTHLHQTPLYSRCPWRPQPRMRRPYWPAPTPQNLSSLRTPPAHPCEVAGVSSAGAPGRAGVPRPARRWARGLQPRGPEQGATCGTPTHAAPAQGPEVGALLPIDELVVAPLPAQAHPLKRHLPPRKGAQGVFANLTNSVGLAQASMGTSSEAEVARGNTSRVPQYNVPGGRLRRYQRLMCA